MARFRRIAAGWVLMIVALSAVGCERLRLTLVRYPETPIATTGGSGLSQSELAGIVAAIR